MNARSSVAYRTIAARCVWLNVVLSGLSLLILGCGRESARPQASDRQGSKDVVADGCPADLPDGGGSAGDIYRLTLFDAHENKDLEVLIPRGDEGWGTGIALTPRWKESSHDLDLSKLSLSRGKLLGELRISFHPNATWPLPGGMSDAVVKVDADVKAKTISGRFESVYDGVTVAGSLGGSVHSLDPRLLENANLVLRLDRPTPIELDGGKRQMSLRIACRRGKAVSGEVVVQSKEVAAGKSCIDVDVTRARITASAVTGEVESVHPGELAVHFKLLGVVVGRQLGGACEVSIDGKTEQRRLLGEIRPLAKGASTPAKAAMPSAVEAGNAPSNGGAGVALPRVSESATQPHSTVEIAQAIDLARKTLALVERSEARPQLAADLHALETRAAISKVFPEVERKRLYMAIRALRRKIILSHPALDFDRLLINKRSDELPEHMVEQYLGRHSLAGPGLVVLQSWKDNPKAIPLTAGRLPPGALLHPDLSADGERVLFSFCDHSASVPKECRAYCLYEMNLETQAIRRATGTSDDPRRGEEGRQTAVIEDIAPCYLPDGGMAFVSTRCQKFARCNGVRYSPVFTLYRGTLDGADLHPISFNESNEWWPCVLGDGRILFTRWDWINRHDVLFQSLWTVRPDGTATAHCYKNNSPWPCLLGEARETPGSQTIVATAAAHHGQTLGSIVLIDPHKGQDHGAPLTVVTPELPFPEAQIPPGTAIAPMPLPGDLPVTSHPRGPRAGTPYPLSEDLFLVAYPHESQLAIYLIDTLGGRELIYHDPEVACMNPIPLRAASSPPVIASSSTGNRVTPTGRFYVQNVYEGNSPLEPGTIKSLRVNQIIAQPTRAKPAVSRVTNEIVKRILGTVPVNDDGSVAFEAPAGMPLQFQLLDADGMAVMTMRSAVYVQSGESLACIGCHEPRQTAPKATAASVAAQVRQLTSSAGPKYEGGLSFARTVQPVLDRYCIECHGLNRTEKINLLGTIYQRPADPLPWPRKFARSYDALMDVPGLVRIAQHNQETYPSRPKDYFAHAGRLARMLLDGHPDKDGRKLAELDRDSLQRIFDWLDLNAQYYGDYSFNRAECQPSLPDGEQALRDAIAARFGPELARQPYAALVNVALPQESRILKAPLAERAHGWGQIGASGWLSADQADYRAMVKLVEASIAPLPAHDIAGTCGRDDGCRCGCCWVRKSRDAHQTHSGGETR